MDGVLYRLDVLVSRSSLPPVLLAGFYLPFNEIHGRRSARPVVLQRFG